MEAFLTKIRGLTSYFWLDFKDFILLYLVFLVVSVVIAFLFLRVWKKTSPAKVVVVNVALFLFLLVHLFYGLELYYRYVFDETDNVLQIKTTQRWIDRHVRINAFSFRNDHFFKEKDTKEVRLAVIGDSYTYGYGIKNEQNRYGNLLEQTLSQACNVTGGTAKVYNMARPGVNTKEAFDFVTMAKDHNVSGIILGYTLDDARSDRTPRHTDASYNRIFSYRRYPFWRAMLDQSFALEYLYVRLYGGVFAKDYAKTYWEESFHSWYRDPEIWLRHLQDLKKIIDYTHEHGLGLTVIIFPNLNELGPGYPAEFIHTRLEQFFAANNIPTIDLLDVYRSYDPAKLMVSPRDFHPNELAHQIAAEQIYEKIKGESWARCRE